MSAIITISNQNCFNVFYFENKPEDPLKDISVSLVQNKRSRLAC